MKSRKNIVVALIVTFCSASNMNGAGGHSGPAASPAPAAAKKAPSIPGTGPASIPGTGPDKVPAPAEGPKKITEKTEAEWRKMYPYLDWTPLYHVLIQGTPLIIYWLSHNSDIATVNTILATLLFVLKDDETKGTILLNRFKLLLRDNLQNLNQLINGKSIIQAYNDGIRDLIENHRDLAAPTNVKVDIDKDAGIRTTECGTFWRFWDQRTNQKTAQVWVPFSND